MSRAAKWWMPWWVLSALERRGYCWADLVFWRQLGKGDVRKRAHCRTVMRDGQTTCYCGYWDQASASPPAIRGEQ